MAGFTIPAQFFAGLEAQVNDFIDASQEAVGLARQEIYKDVTERIADNDRWVRFQDDIEVYDQEGRFYIGIGGVDSVSEAFDVEYGSDVYPPAPIFRMAFDMSLRASRAMNGYFTQRFGLRVA